MLNHELPGGESDKSNAGEWVVASMALVVSTLITGVIYSLMYVDSWANLSAALTDFETLKALMAGPIFFALLCMYLPRVLKCRPPDASKRIET